jgi:hypothetical protein
MRVTEEEYFSSFSFSSLSHFVSSIQGGNTANSKTVNTYGIWLGRNAVASYHHCITFTNETERVIHAKSIKEFQTGWILNSNQIPQCPSYIEDTPTFKEDLYGPYWQTLETVKNRLDPHNLFKNKMGVDPTMSNRRSETLNSMKK